MKLKFKNTLKNKYLKIFLTFSQLAGSIFLIWAVFILLGKINSEKNKNVLPGVPVETLPPTVIEAGEQHPPYLTDPPTSGWYAEYGAREGVHLDPLINEKIVEALAKGFVVITYNCNYNTEEEEEIAPIQPGFLPTSANREEENSNPQIAQFLKKIELQNLRCASTFRFLRDIVNSKGKKGLILTPHTTQDSRIALAAWGRLDKMNLLDRERVEDFIDTFRKNEN